MAAISTNDVVSNNGNTSDIETASDTVPVKMEHDSPELDEAPDGGTRAWLVAAGGHTACFCCLGFLNAFGTFEEYYLTHQLSDRTADDIAWIGSLASFLQLATGLVAGPLFDRFGAKASNHPHPPDGVDPSN